MDDARSFADAARKLRRVRTTPLTADAHADLVKALELTGKAYADMHTAAVTFDRPGWDRGMVQARLREIRVQGAIDALKPLGYTII